MVILSFLIPSPALPAGPGNAEPASAWNFEKLSGDKIPDSGRNGIAGYLNGATTVVVKNGRALKFDGKNDFVNLGVNPALDFQDRDFSIELAVNPADLKEGSALITIDGARGFLVRTGGNYGDKVIMFLNGWDKYRYSQNNAVKIGYWTHVVYVKRGPELDCYIDGRLSNGSSSAIPAKVSTLGNLYIGGSPGYGFFSGLIDEVKIFDRALSPEEIHAHQEQLPFATSTKNLIQKAKKIAKYSLIIALVFFVIYMRIFWARKETSNIP